MSANQSSTIHPPRSGAQHPLRKLPGFYIQAITQPTPRTFARIAEYANWRLIWSQVLLLLLLPVILGGLRLLFHDHSSGINTHSNILFSTIAVLTVGVSIGATIVKAFFVPIIFFLGATLQYVIARILGGHGHYKGHCFSLLAYQVPLTLIGSIAIAVFIILHISTLFFSPLISIVLFCIGVLINIVAVMGVHRLHQNKATAAVIIPYILGVIAAVGIVSVIAHSIISNAS